MRAERAAGVNPLLWADTSENPNHTPAASNIGGM
jgi:hypothetical protein